MDISQGPGLSMSTTAKSRVSSLEACSDVPIFDINMVGASIICVKVFDTAATLLTCWFKCNRF